MDREDKYWAPLGTRPADKKNNSPRIIGGKEFLPPNYRRWSYSQESLENMYKESRFRINGNRLDTYIDKKPPGNAWTDFGGYTTTSE